MVDWNCLFSCKSREVDLARKPPLKLLSIGRHYTRGKCLVKPGLLAQNLILEEKNVLIVLKLPGQNEIGWWFGFKTPFHFESWFFFLRYTKKHWDQNHVDWPRHDICQVLYKCWCQILYTFCTKFSDFVQIRKKSQNLKSQHSSQDCILIFFHSSNNEPPLQDCSWLKNSYCHMLRQVSFWRMIY